MQLGMIGLGRMGANMVRRLMEDGHDCVVFDRSSQVVESLAEKGATGADSIEDLVAKLARPRSVWMMIPAGVVEETVQLIASHLERGDALVDGGNSYYLDDLRRAGDLSESGIEYVDVGVSGGVWGLERGYCMMIGGAEDAVRRLDPVFRSLAPGIGDAARTPGRSGEPTAAESGYLHCGPSGAGHFVKMVHNGIEYALMASYAEGLNILAHANVGGGDAEIDAETTPLRHPEHYRYDFNLAEVAEVWRRGSVIGSWLLDLTASALARRPGLEDFKGHVSDSGEGRWTVMAAVEEGAPVNVISAALFARFASRGETDFADRLLSAMRFEFGGHMEKKL
ncbi:MAG: phosphogluconate dehydrogenase (NAD(+)-dependent, decarboxylating) [Actinomycetota bacterium]